MIATVRAYFDACNAASRERFAEVLAEDCVHYFPPGVAGRTAGATRSPTCGSGS